MSELTLQDVILNVINKDEKVQLNVKKINTLRAELAKNCFYCDFSAGAIETFAYDFPESVQLNEFAMEICYTQEVGLYQDNRRKSNFKDSVKKRIRDIIIDGNQ